MMKIKEYSKLFVACSLTLVVNAGLAQTTLKADTDTLQPTTGTLTSEEKAYLKNNPKKLEELLVLAIQQKDAEQLEQLLPLYSDYPKRDESAIEWGNAIIYESKGDYKNAIRLYRKVNSALPDVRFLQTHMAVALFQDKQYQAAKSQFEKLRSVAPSEEEKQMYNQYISAINMDDDWDINVGLSYINNPNVNNAPPKGTKLISEQGVVTSNAEPENGRGFSYSFSADKKWNVGDNFFTALHLGLDGSHYWNNKSYNELTTDVGVGFGLNNASSEIEFIPFYRNNLSPESNDKRGHLKQYSKLVGVRLNASHWINPQWRYQTGLQLGKDIYIDKYKHLDGAKHNWSNTFLYLPSATQYWFTGLDYGLKNAKDDDDSYKRFGVRAGWGQTWGGGISTVLSAGASRKNHQGEDMFGIKRKDKEYYVSGSIWHRGLHFKGITPKLTWRYNKVDGNHALYNYHNNSVFLSFSKDF